MKHNAREVANRMRRRGLAVRQRLTENAQAEARILEAEAVKVMETEIYAIPVPRTAGGKPKWTRTTLLKRSERATVQGTTVTLKNSAPYSGPRARLGTPKGRPIISPGIRSVQWQERAVQRRRAILLRMKQRAVQSALRNP